MATSARMRALLFHPRPRLLTNAERGLVFVLHAVSRDVPGRQALFQDAAIGLALVELTGVVVVVTAGSHPAKRQGYHTPD